MAETKAISYSYQELAEILVKEQDIHEGLWGIVLEFGLQGSLLALPGGNHAPGAVIPVTKIGIHKFDEPNPMTVDAAQVNPLA